MAGLARIDELRPLDFDDEPPTETLRPADPPKLRGGLGAMIVLLVIWWAVAAFIGWRSFVWTPFSDMHDWLLRLFQAERDHDWLGYLWAPHGNQRIVFARIFTWWDVEVARGHGVSAFLGSGMKIQLIVALAAAVVTAAYAPRSPWRLWIGGLVGLILLDIPFVDDAALANAGVYIEAAGFSVLAVLAFALRGDTGWRRAMLPVAVACGVFAACGNAAGLAVWPVLAFGAWRSHAERVALITVIVAGVLTIVLFSLGLGAPVGSGSAGSAGVGRLVKMVSYFFGYVALPWASEPRLPLRLAGAVLTGFYLVLLVRGPAREGGGLLRRAGLDLIAVTLLTALMAAIGRVDEQAPANVPVRYAVFAMAGQAGLVMVFAARLAGWATARPRLAGGLLALALVAVGLNQAEGARRLTKSMRHVREASEAFDRGDRSPEVVSLVYPPDAAHAADVRRQLKARGLPY